MGELCGDKFLDTVLDVRAACGHVERILASNLEPTERAFCPHDACVHWALAQTGRWENTEVMRARDNEILARQQLAQEREERKKAELVLQTQRNVLQINQIKVDERGVPLEPQRSQQSRKRSKMSGPEDRPTDSETPGTAATATTDTAAPEGSAVGHAEVDAAALQTELGSLRTENETLRRQNRMHADQLAAVEAANVKEHRTAEARTLKAQIEAKEAKRELKVERAKAAAVRLAADTPSGALTAAPTAEAASTAAAAAPTALAAAAMGPSDPTAVLRHVTALVAPPQPPPQQPPGTALLQPPGTARLVWLPQLRSPVIWRPTSNGRSWRSLSRWRRRTRSQQKKRRRGRAGGEAKSTLLLWIVIVLTFLMSLVATPTGAVVVLEDKVGSSICWSSMPVRASKLSTN